MANFRSLNRVSLVGKVVKAPRIARNKEDTNTLVWFIVATNEALHEQGRKKGSKLKFYPSYHSVNCWGKLAETMGMLLKTGSLVAVDGKLRYYKKKIGDETVWLATIYADDVAAIDYLKDYKAEQKEDEGEDPIPEKK